MSNYCKELNNPSWKMPDGSIRILLHHDNPEVLQFTYVDAADIKRISEVNGAKLTWMAYARNKGEETYYEAKATVGSKGYLMHRLILSVPERVQVTHEDGNKLNNRRANIRTKRASSAPDNRIGVTTKSKWRADGVRVDATFLISSEILTLEPKDREKAIKQSVAYAAKLVMDDLGKYVL